MTEQRDSRALLVIAKQFRDAASGAGRLDVVEKIDEAIILLARADPGTDRADDGNEKSTIVLRILDGLGF